MLLSARYEKLSADVLLSHVTRVTGLPLYDVIPLSVVLFTAIALVDLWAVFLPMQLVLFAWPAYQSLIFLEDPGAEILPIKLIDWWMCRGGCAVCADLIASRFAIGAGRSVRMLLDVAGQVALLVYSDQIDLPSPQTLRAMFTRKSEDAEEALTFVGTEAEYAIVAMGAGKIKEAPVWLREIQSPGAALRDPLSTPSPKATIATDLHRKYDTGMAPDRLPTEEAASPAFSDFSLASLSSLTPESVPGHPETHAVGLERDPATKKPSVPHSSASDEPQAALGNDVSAGEYRIPNPFVIDTLMSPTTAEHQESMGRSPRVTTELEMLHVLPDTGGAIEIRSGAIGETRNSRPPPRNSSLRPAVPPDSISISEAEAEGETSRLKPTGVSNDLVVANTTVETIVSTEGDSSIPITDTIDSLDETLRLLLEDENMFMFEESPYSAIEARDNPPPLVPKPIQTRQHIVVPRPNREPERKMSHLSMLLQQEPDFLLDATSNDPEQPMPTLHVPGERPSRASPAHLPADTHENPFAVADRLAVPLATRRKSIAKDVRAHRPPPPRKHSLDAAPQQRLSMGPISRKGSSLDMSAEGALKPSEPGQREQPKPPGFDLL